MTIMIKASLAAVVALGAIAPLASANSISIGTDRVQVQVGEDGAINIRTSNNRPQLFDFDDDNYRAVPSSSLTPVPYGSRCQARTYSSHSQSQRYTPSGDRIYSSYSSTRLCQ